MKLREPGAPLDTIVNIIGAFFILFITYLDKLIMALRLKKGH